MRSVLEMGHRQIINLISSVLMDFNNAVKQDPGPQLFGNNMGWPKNEGYS